MESTDPGTLLDDLVDSHWKTAARHAWRQYQERGRGAIVFPLSEDPASNERTPLQYLTFDDVDAARDGPFSMLYELVHTYSPTEEVVIAAVLPDDRTVFDIYEHAPAPPDA